MAVQLPTAPWFLDLPNTYDAAALRAPWKDVFSDGVVGVNDCLVVPRGGTPAAPDSGGGLRNMSVDVLPGAAWITGTDTPGTQGIYRMVSFDSADNLVVAGNSSGNPRIDLIIAQVLDSPNNLAQFDIVQGTPASSPTPPALPADAIPLAHIAVANGATEIDAAQVTDVRSRHFRSALRASPGSNTSITPGTAWTALATVTFTLDKPWRVVVSAIAAFNSSGSGRPFLAAGIIDENNDPVGVAGIAQLGGTGDPFASQWSIALPAKVIDLDEGAHSFTLQAYKDGAGSANAIDHATYASERFQLTELEVVI